MKIELKTCPCCGREAELLTMRYIGGEVYGVFCKSGSEHGHFIDNYATPEEAIAA